MDDGADHASRGVVGRYWRGELGLSRLLWKPVAAAAAVMAACLGLVVASGLFAPMPAFFLGLAAWTAALAVAAWLCLGLFRSGMTHGRRGGRALGYGVAALAGLAVIAVAARGPGLVRANLEPSFARVQESLPSSVAIRAIHGGTELVLDGYFDNGSAKALREAAAKYPAVTRIRLGGAGGELRESRWIRDFIAEQGWDTYTSTECWSGCAIAFLGGVRRTIGPGARLGFHSASIWPLGNEAKERAVNEQIALEMIERGVDPVFARKAWSKQHGGMWFPSHEALIRAGLVHAAAAL